jgi:hypothetical protein
MLQGLGDTKYIKLDDFRDIGDDFQNLGEVAERLNAPVLKTGSPLRGS